MRINPINIYKANNFAGKKIQPPKIAEERTEITYNNGSMPYDADICISKTGKDGTASREYFKDGEYIVHEIISPMKHDIYPFEADYQEIDVFDRRIGEHTSKRRYSNGRTDVLIKGSWDSKNRYEIEHQDENGQTTGFTVREYTDYTTGLPYWEYDHYCAGDIYYRYFQTKYDKNHKPIGAFAGLETIQGNRTFSP